MIDELRENGNSSVSKVVLKKETELAKVHAGLLSRIAEIYDYRDTYERDMAEIFVKTQSVREVFTSWLMCCFLVFCFSNTVVC